MAVNQLYLVKALEKPVGQYPSTFIELTSHFYLGRTRVTNVNTNTLTAIAFKQHVAMFESLFNRISELVLATSGDLVSFRGIVIQSEECTLGKSKAVRTIVVDESGQCIAFCQFNGAVMEIDTLMYCRLAQVYTDQTDHHIELSCVGATYIASDLKLIDAPPALQSFHRTNDMANMIQYHNRSTSDDLEETTMSAMIIKLEEKYAIDEKTRSAVKAASASSAAGAAAAAASTSSSSSTASSSHSPMNSASRAGAKDHALKYTMSGYVLLKAKRFNSGPTLYYNACVQQSKTSWGDSTCNKGVVKLVPGQPWMDHKDRPAGVNVHRSASCTQRYMFTVVFEEEVTSQHLVCNDNAASMDNEYPYRVFDEFGTALMGLVAPDFALLPNERQEDAQKSLENAAMYVVTISRNGVIENMQLTKCSGD